MLARDILRYCVVQEHIGNDQKQFKLGRAIPTTLIRVVVAITLMSVLEIYHHIHKKHDGKRQKPPVHDELGNIKLIFGLDWDKMETTI